MIGIYCYSYSGAPITSSIKYLMISSYDYYSVVGNTPIFSPLKLPDLVFQQGQTPNYNILSSAMYAFNTSYLNCGSFALSSCFLYEVYNYLPFVAMSVINSGTEVSMSAFPTSTKGSNYYSMYCSINPCTNGMGDYLTNEFKVSIINCVAPPINTINVKSSYSYYVQT
jgi:hypothetical protein